MRNVFLFIILVATASTALAQQPLLKIITPQKKKEKPSPFPSMNRQLPDISPDTTIEPYQKYLEAYRIKEKLLSRATYSHTTSRGKIYTLPVDNMPCLVPDMEQVMPMPGNPRPIPENRMPNSIPKQRSIPNEKEKDNK